MIVIIPQPRSGHGRRRPSRPGSATASGRRVRSARGTTSRCSTSRPTTCRRRWSTSRPGRSAAPPPVSSWRPTTVGSCGTSRTGRSCEWAEGRRRAVAPACRTPPHGRHGAAARSTAGRSSSGDPAARTACACASGRAGTPGGRTGSASGVIRTERRRCGRPPTATRPCRRSSSGAGRTSTRIPRRSAHSSPLRPRRRKPKRHRAPPDPAAPAPLPWPVGSQAPWCAGGEGVPGPDGPVHVHRLSRGRAAGARRLAAGAVGSRPVRRRGGCVGGGARHPARRPRSGRRFAGPAVPDARWP